MEINIIITKEVIDEVLLHKTTRYNRFWSSLFGDDFQAIWAFDMLDQTTLMLIGGGTGGAIIGGVVGLIDYLFFGWW